MVDATSAKRRRGRQDGNKHRHADNKTSHPARDAEQTAQQKLLVVLTENEPTWYEVGQQQVERNATIITNPPTKASARMTPELVSRYRRDADELYQKELFAFNKGNQKNSDDRWVEGTMKKGTLKDRIAAMSVVASTDPIHKLYALDGLLQMAGCSESGSQQTNSRVVQLAAEALEDLFLNTYLPPDRKLLSLSQRPLYMYESTTDGKSRVVGKTLPPKVLLLWRFEEMVKEKYQRFIRQCLEKTLREGMEMDKIAALRSVSSLLSAVPEGESILLQLLVNKIGDPGKKVAAAAAHELRKVLQKHPSMQAIIAREVQQLAFRPGLRNRALYQCITFLNQLKLVREKPDASGNVKSSLAASLISSYFRLFDVAIKKHMDSREKDDPEESEMKSRLLSALLTGVNRAHPYLPEKDQTLEDHMDSLYRVVHTAPPAACTQSLLLLFHVVVGAGQREGSEDSTSEAQTKRQKRFYRALYASLSKINLLSSGKHLTMIFNLLYKAMKYDTDTTRVIAFAKRILCTTMHCSCTVVAACIFLLNEVARTHPVVLSCFQETLEEPNCRRILDASKREPDSALVLEDVRDEGRTTTKKAPLWELALLNHHAHPSVSKFVSSFGHISYSGDPLRDFSLQQFLDKFAYRNPKTAKHAEDKTKGLSVGARRSAKETVNQSIVVPVNDPSFLQRQKVDVHDEFFHRFFIERAKRDRLKGVTRSKASEGHDEIEEHAEEEMALHEEEQFDGGLRFEDYERDWESDSDEEAFVDSLAQQIIEDAIDKFGPNDLDAEDPDMDDWETMYDDGSLDGVQDGYKAMTRGRVDDEDGESEEEDDDDKFMDDDQDDDSEAPSLTAHGTLEDEDDDGGDDVVFALDGSASDEEEEDEERRKELKDLPTFADADEYESIIEESWIKQPKRPLSGNESGSPLLTRDSSKKGRKRRKEKR